MQPQLGIWKRFIPRSPEGADQTHDSLDVIHQHLTETNNGLVSGVGWYAVALLSSVICGEGEGEVNRPFS